MKFDYINKVYNMDYLIFLRSIPDSSIDFVCIDPPYGKIQGLKLSGQSKKVDWDIDIDWKEMFVELNRVLKPLGTIAAFGQQPSFSKMVMDNIKDFKYELIWEKNNTAQGYWVKTRPLNYTENIAIYVNGKSGKGKRVYNNLSEPDEVNKKVAFSRWYSQAIQKYINLPRRKIHKILGHRRTEFFFYYVGEHFSLVSEEVYNELISEFKINKMKNFVSYRKLKNKFSKEKSKIIKLQKENFLNHPKNIIRISKDYKPHLHPTQKPTELIENLIKTYSNEGDIVLDCFAGSGTTFEAANNCKRKFTGCELDEEFYKTIIERIK